jgi:hypothetical protein
VQLGVSAPLADGTVCNAQVVFELGFWARGDSVDTHAGDIDILVVRYFYSVLLLVCDVTPSIGSLPRCSAYGMAVP